MCWLKLVAKVFKLAKVPIPAFIKFNKDITIHVWSGGLFSAELP